MDVVVAFFHMGKVMVGEEIERNQNGSFIKFNGSTRFFPSSQILGRALSDKEKLMEKVKKCILDLEVLWSEGKTLSEEEISEIIFGNVSEENLLAVKVALNSEENFFFKKVGGDWNPRNKEEVINLKTSYIKRKERERLEREFLKTVLSSKRIDGIPVSDEIKKFPEIMNEIKDFFIFGKGGVKNLVSKFIHTKEDLKKFLVLNGFMEEDENIFIKKFGISIEPVHYNFFVEERNEVEEAFTVDVEGTEIRDDAITISGDEIMVHIADTSALDDMRVIRMVAERGKTIYFPEGKIDIFSNDVLKKLSLDEGTKKNAITIKINLKDFSFSIKKTRIKILKNYEFSNCDIRELEEIGINLLRKRLSSGGLFFMKNEKNLLYRDGKIIWVNWPLTPHKIAISEISILSSYIIAKFSKENNIPIFFRKSERKKDKDEEKICLEKIDFEIIKKLSDPRNVWKSIKRASYSYTTTYPAKNENIGCELYAWGTSPIRRAWDFINIIQISRYLKGERFLDLEPLKHIIETRISIAETVEFLRWKYWFAKYLMTTKRIFPAIVVEKSQRSVYWLDDFCVYLRGGETKREEGENVMVRIGVDILKPDVWIEEEI